MSNFYTDVIMKSPKFRSVEPVRDLDLLEPVTRAAVQAIVEAAAKLGHRLIIAETYRSAERQLDLYEKRLTELKEVGVHRYGLACDLALDADGKYDPRGEDYLFMRTLAETHGLISGVDWGEPTIAHSFRDWDHVQRVTIKRQSALFRGEWYPDAAYRPLPDLGRSVATAMAAPLIERKAA